MLLYFSKNLSIDFFGAFFCFFFQISIFVIYRSVNTYINEFSAHLQFQAPNFGPRPVTVDFAHANFEWFRWDCACYFRSHGTVTWAVRRDRYLDTAWRRQIVVQKRWIDRSTPIDCNDWILNEWMKKKINNFLVL